MSEPKPGSSTSNGKPPVCDKDNEFTEKDSFAKERMKNFLSTINRSVEIRDVDMELAAAVDALPEDGNYNPNDGNQGSVSTPPAPNPSSENSEMDELIKLISGDPSKQEENNTDTRVPPAIPNFMEIDMETRARLILNSPY